MSKTPHIIEQQFLEVTFTDRREGMGLQDQLATIYKEKVLPLLETVLNDHDLTDHTIQIDEITIDAGVLSSKTGSRNWWSGPYSNSKPSCRRSCCLPGHAGAISSVPTG